MAGRLGESPADQEKGIDGLLQAPLTMARLAGDGPVLQPFNGPHGSSIQLPESLRPVLQRLRNAGILRQQRRNLEQLIRTAVSSPLASNRPGLIEQNHPSQKGTPTDIHDREFLAGW